MTTQLLELAIKAVSDSGNLALRTLVLINGGAAIAFLAFFGNIVGANTIELSLEQATSPLLWFVWGVGFAAVGMCLSYLAGLFTIKSLSSREYRGPAPFGYETDNSKFWSILALLVTYVTIFLVVLSLGSFMVGMYEARTALISR